MKFISFVLTYPFIWLLSRLPMRILYLIATFFYFIIYYIVGYRKEIVFKNLELSFPKKTKEELKQIRKKFYGHFVDLFIESIKAFSISEKEIKKRYVYKNPELLNKYVREGRSIAMMGAHLANWEWSVNMSLHTKIKCFGAYTRLQNKYFDKKIKKSRQKFGFYGYKTSDFIKGMQENFNNNIQGLYLLLSDQSPRPKKAYYWREFLGVKVPVHTGAEMLSKRFDMVVLNYVAKKIKRGYYEIEFQLITDQPKTFDNYKITDLYTALTEENIKEQPELYLWTHKRFKHRNKVPKAFL